MGQEKYLLVKGRAGMGNRVMCLITAMLYARLTGRKLIVDWRDGVYSQDGSNIFHRLFSCGPCRPDEELPDGGSVAPALWRGRLGLSVPELQRGLARERFNRESTIDVSRLDYDEDIAVMSVYDTHVHLLRRHLGPGAPDTPDLVRSLLAELVLRPDIQAQVDGLRAQHLPGRSVGVHVRMTDYRLPVGAVLRELHALLEREPDLHVFLATDNIEAKRLMEARYPNLFSAPHWYPPPGAPMHNSPACPDRVQNAVEALVDLYLLGGCHHIVGDTGSAFTRIAGLLQPEGASGIIDVRPRRSRRRLLHRWLWSRYMWGDSAGWRALRKAVRATNLSTVPARAQMLRSRARRRRQAIRPSARN